jgi:hypothetical protein
MGYYWTNFIYYGVIISSEQHEILVKNAKHYIKSYEPYRRKCGNFFIICIPQTFYNFKNIDAMFETHEIEQGFVHANDVKLSLRAKLISESQVNHIFNPPESQKNVLIQILKLLNDDKLNPKLEMLQIFSSLFNDDDSVIDHILEVKFK